MEDLWSQLSAANLTSILKNATISQELLPLLASSSSAIRLPPSLQTALFPSSSSSSSTPRSGCNDAFSVFAFLAFLLALLQLVQDMARKRKRRGAGDGGYHGLEDEEETVVCQERGRQAAIAAHTMFQGFFSSKMTHTTKILLAGFLNAMDNNVEDCPAWSICEASREAGGRGTVGGVVARFLVFEIFWQNYGGGRYFIEARNTSVTRVSGHQAAQWLKQSKAIERAALQVKCSLPNLVANSCSVPC